MIRGHQQNSLFFQRVALRLSGDSRNLHRNIFQFPQAARNLGERPFTLSGTLHSLFISRNNLFRSLTQICKLLIFRFRLAAG